MFLAETVQPCPAMQFDFFLPWPGPSCSSCSSCWPGGLVALVPLVSRPTNPATTTTTTTTLSDLLRSPATTHGSLVAAQTCSRNQDSTQTASGTASVWAPATTRHCWRPSTASQGRSRAPCSTLAPLKLHSHLRSTLQRSTRVIPRGGYYCQHIETTPHQPPCLPPHEVVRTAAASSQPVVTGAWPRWSRAPLVPSLSSAAAVLDGPNMTICTCYEPRQPIRTWFDDISCTFFFFAWLAQPGRCVVSPGPLFWSCAGA